MGRAPCCDKANVKKGAWSPEEAAKLKAYIEEHGIGAYWLSLPHKIGLKRCGKSCRLRWLNYLRHNIKHGGFSEEEDQVICSLYISIGSRWSMIAAQLLGRTDNDVKNHWNTRLKKKLLGMQTEPSQSPCLPAQTLSASALQRMQLLYAFFLSNIPALGGKLLETSHQTLPQMEQEIQISMSQIVQEDMDCSWHGVHPLQYLMMETRV
ncbi:unnamed protein product [Musa acuminata subsp. malaccensis]|uniref:(wild Malaysian banana) hypothetical protein n=1 Tax=Musa acuminata subsp. malaccensis TaxID=214687 RepID=A0A804J800_MUSAM|nr:PREDICTED: transcription factor RAX3-like [Musa acuminata subsp. malaccensis]CAG1839439.1 unnamed protein product [Musa acuminata subsp. malaccensis]